MNDLTQLKVGDPVLIRFSSNDSAIYSPVREITKSGSIRVGSSLYNPKTGRRKGAGESYSFQYIEPYNKTTYKNWLTKREKMRLVRLFGETRFQDLSLEALQELLTVLQKHRKADDGKPISNPPTA